MVTIAHLRAAWHYALIEIEAAIFHLESGAGNDPTTSADDATAAEAWLVNLRRDRIDYNVLLANHPSVH